jgi:lysophospholipase L1-like esterase
MTKMKEKNQPGANVHGSKDFLRAHATGITVALFFSVATLLGFSSVPPELKPVDLQTAESRSAVLERVFRKPRLTFSVDNVQEEFELEPEVFLDEEDAVVPEPPDATKTDLAMAQMPKDALPQLVRKGLEITKDARRLRRMATVLKAKGAKIENPCVRQGAEGCEATALDPFFVRLDAIDAFSSNEPSSQTGSAPQARVVALGNSLVASDHITDIVRERLNERFGDAGRGYLLPDRLSKIAGRRVRTGRGKGAWKINTFAQKKPQTKFFGFAGSHHQSNRKGDQITWALRGSSEAKLFWLTHEKGANFEISIDGETQKQIANSSGPQESRIFDMEIPAGSKKMQLIADGPNVVLYGVALKRPNAGVSWDTVGVPASDARMYVDKVDPAIFASQLAARDPTLVVVMVGGNEVRSMSFGWTTLEKVKTSYEEFLDLVKSSVPDAACLGVAPIDAAKATAAGARLTTRKQILEVVAMQKEVAKAKGCGYFDLFSAMGGAGSLQRFHRKRLVNDDLVHPRGKGGDVLGQLFADALFDAYVSAPIPEAAGKNALSPSSAATDDQTKTTEPGFDRTSLPAKEPLPAKEKAKPMDEVAPKGDEG